MKVNYIPQKNDKSPFIQIVQILNVKSYEVCDYYSIEGCCGQHTSWYLIADIHNTYKTKYKPYNCMTVMCQSYKVAYIYAHSKSTANFREPYIHSMYIFQKCLFWNLMS